MDTSEPRRWGGGGGLGSYILLDRGTPMQMDDTIGWAMWMETERRKPVGKSLWRVARTPIPGWGLVSTTFLGLDHGWGMGGPPILFETMAFWRPRRVRDDSFVRDHRKSRSQVRDAGQWRYATWAEAEAGHRKAVESFRRHGKELMRLYLAGRKKDLERLLSEAGGY